jgi:ubiquinone/menaquinone biosynthesis C-methylase UbiE
MCTMSKLTARTTTKEWRRLGKDDPLFAVAAHPDRSKAWDLDGFYVLGETDWADFARHWRQYQPDLGGRCLEIGSGAGRVTKQLIGLFNEVHGIDVSPEMLNLAAVAAPSATFHLVEDTRVPLEDASVDAVFTCHVLQHLEEQSEVADYLAEAHRVLSPGGTLMAHLLLTEVPLPLPRRAWAEGKLRLTRVRRANRGAYSRVCRYRPDQVRGMLEGVGFADVEMREFRVASNGSTHPFWFARRAL